MIVLKPMQKVVLAFLSGAISCGILLFGIALPFRTVVSRVAAYRAQPRPERVGLFLKGNRPHDILGRYLLLRSGTKGYLADLREQIYLARGTIPGKPPQNQSGGSGENLSDTLWNRMILERDAPHIDSDDLHLWLPRYPLRITNAILKLAESDLNAGHPEEAIVLENAEGGNGKQALHAWIQTNILQPENVQTFVADFPYFVNCDSVQPVQLLTEFWPKLNHDQHEELLSSIAVNLYPQQLATEQLFIWYIRALSNGQLDGIESAPHLLGKFISFQEQRDRAIDLLSNTTAQLDPKGLASMLDTLNSQRLFGDTVKLAINLFTRTFQKNPDIATGAFEFMLTHGYVEGCEKIARVIIAAGDSQLRKNLIVLLMNHDSTLARQHLDDAFRGSAPRTAKFDDSDEYAFGNTAHEYERLAHHDYLGPGKTWPPSSGKGFTKGDDVVGWRTFIATYPWFPGTDDAYYRLAYSQYVSGDLSGALQSIADYVQVRPHLPDNDAADCIFFVLREIAANDKSASLNNPLISNLRVIVTDPLAKHIFDPHPDLSRFLLSVAWFLRDDAMISSIGADRNSLETMTQAARLIHDTPLKERVATIQRFLEDNHAEAGGILYSQFFVPLYAKGFTNGSDPAEQTAADLAHRASVIFEQSARGGPASQEQLAAFVEWVLLMTKEDTIGAPYKTALKALSTLDPTALPQPVRKDFETWLSPKTTPKWDFK
jgi:hypothetical protein